MRKFKLLTPGLTGLCLLLTLPNCRKNDWVHVPPGYDRCDYSSAYSKSISDDSQELVPLFVKKYKPGTFKLEEILLQYRNPAGNGYTPGTYKLTYLDQRIIIARDNTDTTWIDLDNTGRPKKAVSKESGGRYRFKFMYTTGKLSEILYNFADSEDNEWFSFAKVTYDQNKENVKKVLFNSDLQTEELSYNYEYDYSKKLKYQYYPEERHGETFYFWLFVNHLRFFPELLPENLRTRAYYQTSDYPGKYDTRYSNHQIDANGKLVSYRATIQADYGLLIENWKVNWTCF